VASTPITTSKSPLVIPWAVVQDLPVSIEYPWVSTEDRLGMLRFASKAAVYPRIVDLYYLYCRRRYKNTKSDLLGAGSRHHVFTDMSE